MTWVDRLMLVFLLQMPVGILVGKFLSTLDE